MAQDDIRVQGIQAFTIEVFMLRGHVLMQNVQLGI